MSLSIPAVPSATNRHERIAVALRIGIVVMALATAAIHVSLGGMLFLLNAAGFAVLALGMIMPGAFAARFRWAPRLGLAGFSAATIGGWVLFGARYEMGYLATGIEVAIIAFLVVDLVQAYGSPLALTRRVIHDLTNPRSGAPAAA